jgi:hypothetical protein
MVLIGIGQIPSTRDYDIAFQLLEGKEVITLDFVHPGSTNLYIAYWGGKLLHSYRYFAGSPLNIPVGFSYNLFSCFNSIQCPFSMLRPSSQPQSYSFLLDQSQTFLINIPSYIQEISIIWSPIVQINCAERYDSQQPNIMQGLARLELFLTETIDSLNLMEQNITIKSFCSISKSKISALSVPTMSFNLSYPLSGMWKLRLSILSSNSRPSPLFITRKLPLPSLSIRNGMNDDMSHFSVPNTNTADNITSMNNPKTILQPDLHEFPPQRFLQSISPPSSSSSSKLSSISSFDGELMYTLHPYTIGQLAIQPFTVLQLAPTYYQLVADTSITEIFQAMNTFFVVDVTEDDQLQKLLFTSFMIHLTIYESLSHNNDVNREISSSFDYSQIDHWLQSISIAIRSGNLPSSEPLSLCDLHLTTLTAADLSNRIIDSNSVHTQQNQQEQQKQQSSIPSSSSSHRRIEYRWIISNPRWSNFYSNLQFVPIYWRLTTSSNSSNYTISTSTLLESNWKFQLKIILNPCIQNPCQHNGVCIVSNPAITNVLTHSCLCR